MINIFKRKKDSGKFNKEDFIHVEFSVKGKSRLYIGEVSIIAYL